MVMSFPEKSQDQHKLFNLQQRNEQRKDTLQEKTFSIAFSLLELRAPLRKYFNTQNKNGGHEVNTFLFSIVFSLALFSRLS